MYSNKILIEELKERIIAILLIFYDKINESVNGDIHENLNRVLIIMNI